MAHSDIVLPVLSSSTPSQSLSQRSSLYAPNDRNPFATPDSQRSQSRLPYFPEHAPQFPEVRKRKFKSARLRTKEYEKPWLAERNPRRKWERIIFWSSILIGFLLGGIICYLAYASVTNLEYCLVFQDDFLTLDTDVWNHEIQRGGFGTGSFEWTTDSSKNSYVDAEGLHIIPTLTTDSAGITPAQINNNYVLNLTTAKTCTSPTKNINDCSIRSNVTSGAIINPVQSARLNTMGKKTIKYGRVEVIAKLPRGDWLWPAIWLMPEPQDANGDGAYGPWPASGEIDIMESRGNAGKDYPDGRDSVGSTLHWGPLAAVDAFWKTSGKHNIRRADYSDNFHKFGLEWNENYLFTYVDTRLVQVLFTKFTNYDSMWDHGDFGASIVNKSALNDPWSFTGRKNTPFDQPFYLILNVAVGGTNGYFKDAVANKPWGDGSFSAPREFWDAQDQWYPTWGAGDTRGLTVKQVKMWNQGACGAK